MQRLVEKMNTHPRAVSVTIEANAGTDDPDNVAWPTPGDSFAGQGDGGGDAVVGTSNDVGGLLMRTTATYEISNAVVSIVKAATNVLPESFIALKCLGAMYPPTPIKANFFILWPF